jgi:hypothetical protein
MNPQLHFLRGHSLAKSACNFVSHAPPPGRLRRPPSPFGGGIANLLRAPESVCRINLSCGIKTTVQPSYREPERPAAASTAATMPV